MSRLHKTLTDVIRRIGLSDYPTPIMTQLLGPEVMGFLSYSEADAPMARPALIAQIAKVTGTTPRYWLSLELLDAEEAANNADTSHINQFTTITTPVVKGHCVSCGSERIVKFNSLNFRQCTECNNIEPHNLREGQSPLFGSSRNVTKG